MIDRVSSWRALCGMALGLASLVANAQNLIRNGDFSQGGDPPKQWNRDGDTASKGKVRITPEGVLELWPNAANTPSNKPLALGQAIDAANLAGKTLTLTAQLGLRAPADGAVVGLHALRDNGTEIGNVQLRASSAGAGLESQSGTLVIAPQEKPKLLILIVVAEGLGGAALFDSIAVTVGNATAAAPSPASRAAGAGTAYPARVTVDAAQITRAAIPRGLYGVNIEWWRNANGLWDDKTDRVQPEFLALSQNLAPTLIRFPGGFLGDTYDWRTGTGARAQRRPTVTNPGGDEKHVPFFGTDELLQFAGSVGADLLLTANAGNGTPEMAAGWVRYIKEAQAKNPGLPRVQWWEIGNELYHKGDASGASLTPEAYADKLKLFAKAMKAVDPAVRIGAIGGVNHQNFPFISYNNWTEVVLRRAGADIDLLAVHNGYAPVVPDDRADPRGVYQALWAAPLMVAENLRITAEQIRKYAPADRADHIKMSVTEWAPLFHIAPTSPWIDHSKTLGSALYVADLLRVFVQNDRVDSATFFKLNEQSFLGLIGMRRGQWIPNASYYAFELYTRHFGSTLIGSRSEAPTFDSVKTGIVPAMQRVPLLESLASLSADKSKLYVILVNKSLDQSADVDLGIAGFTPAAGTAQLLTGPSPDANTGSELPRLPGLKWATQINMTAGKLFDQGNPAQISFTATPIPNAGRAFTYRLPPHSVVSLELRATR